MAATGGQMQPSRAGFRIFATCFAVLVAVALMIDHNSRMKILVTGGAGYIGSHTIAELISAGFNEVISADNFVRSTPNSLERIQELTGVSVSNYNIDLTSAAAVEALFADHTDIAGIIHFAALKTVPESVEEPLLYYRNNMMSLINVLAGMVKHNVKHFVFSSSCSVYGNINELPVHEGTALQPAQSPYAQTKLFGEQVVADTAKLLPESQLIALRYFNPAGAHLSGRLGEWPIDPPQALVPVICQTAAGLRPSLTIYGDDYETRDGTCVRDYVHVSDIARAHVAALNYNMAADAASNFDIINLGSGTGTTVLEAIEAFETVSGTKLPYTIGPRRAGDVVAIYSDCTKAHTLLNWKPELGIKEMMETAWAWQKSLA